MPLQLLVTSKFLRSYRSASPNLQAMAEGAVHDFVKRYRSAPTTCIRHYEPVKRLQTCKRLDGTQTNIREFEIGGGERMLCDWIAPTLTLVDLGNHSLISKSDCLATRNALTSLEDAPAQFWPTSRRPFFVQQPSSRWKTFANELSPDWIYYLDDEQRNVVESIYDDSIDVLLSAGYHQVHAIIGGPGTGKTSILLNLLKRYHDEGDICVQMVATDEVCKYLHSATHIDPGHFANFVSSEANCEVFLFDDPPNTNSLKQIVNIGKDGRAKVIVLAFDPLQLDDALSDAEYRAFLKAHKVREHILRTCYRQKENVGIATKEVVDSIAQSTPFLATEKQQAHWEEHRRLTEISNQLRFVNPFGYTQLHENAKLTDLESELDSLLRQPGGLWRHYPPLLVAVVDDSLETLPERWRQKLEQSRIRYRLVTAPQLGQIKGVEYQHVFVVTGQGLWAQLNQGFQGSGRKTYNQRRLLRIPFSRAKDRLVVFVLSKF